MRISTYFLVAILTFFTANCGQNSDNIDNNHSINSTPTSPTEDNSHLVDNTDQDDSQSELTEDDNTIPPGTEDPTAYSDTFTDCIHYRDFGAIGDGKNNDHPALVKTHLFANENNRCVQADQGATYYIAAIEESAAIKTNTDWRGAKFIIDDSEVDISVRTKDVFIIRPSIEGYQLRTGGVNQGAAASFDQLSRHQEKLALELPYSAVLIIYDSNTKKYIREGANQNSGAVQQDVLLVNADGSIAPESPIMWDYQQVTDIQVYPIDETPLLVVGGTFTTIANQAESAYNYYSRGIYITRSNVTIDGIKHYITGELDQGAPYSGFITMKHVANVTIKNTLFTAHKIYATIGSAGSSVSMGTYDIGPSHTINLTFDNCAQTTDILDKNYWGLMGSNYCKNIVLNKCKFSRFDAHQGVVNATITNSTLGHQGIQLIGEGLFTIKNSTVLSANFLTLRTDYGSTWNGQMDIIDCTWDPYGTGLNYSPFINGSYSGKHDFGYECYMPHTINISGLHVNNLFPVYLLADITPANINDNFSYQYPYHITETINISGYEASGGDHWNLSLNSYMFRNITINEQ